MWETPNLIASTQYKFECEADNCLCPNGKHENTNEWPLFICELCGTYGLHKQCAPEDCDYLANYVCKSCGVLSRKSTIEMPQAECGDEVDDSVVMVEDAIETITVSSGPLCVSKWLCDELSKVRLNAFLMAPYEDNPLDPWIDDSDDEENDYGLRFS